MGGRIAFDVENLLLYGILFVLVMIMISLEHIERDLHQIQLEVAPREWERKLEDTDAGDVIDEAIDEGE